MNTNAGDNANETQQDKKTQNKKRRENNIKVYNDEKRT